MPFQTHHSLLADGGIVDDTGREIEAVPRAEGESRPGLGQAKGDVALHHINDLKTRIQQVR